MAACSFIASTTPLRITAEKLYREAKEALDGGHTTRVKRYERSVALSLRRYSQQGQLECLRLLQQSEQASPVAATGGS